MAAPSVTTSWPFSITATGEDQGALIRLPQDAQGGPPIVLNVGVYGTYTTGVLVVRKRLNGMTTFFPIAGTDLKAATAVGTGGSITLSNSTTYLFSFAVNLGDEVEVYASSLASGSISVEQSYGPASPLPAPIVNASVSTVAAGTTTITSTSASALTVGANGATNPVLDVDASTSSVATGLKITGAAAAAGVDITVISSGTNENLTINAKGSGTITLNPTGTGAVTITPATTITGILTSTGGITMADSANIVTNGTTGTKIGTATTNKIGMWNATPIVQPANTVDVFTGLVNVGLRASGGTAACTLPGALSAAALTVTSIVGTGDVALTGHMTITNAKNIVLDTSTGTKIGTATTQKLSFFNATPVVQPVASTDASTGAAGGTNTVYLNTTFTGNGGSGAYTIGGIATALKALGLLAA